MFSSIAARLRAFRDAHLHDNWAELLLNAWSVRFAVLAAVCDGIALFCGFFTDAPDAYRPWFAGIGMAATIAAPIARLVPQKNVSEGAA